MAEDPEDPEDGDGEEGEGKPAGGLLGSKKFLILGGVGLLVILLGVGAALYFTVFSSPPAAEAGEHAEDDGHGDGHGDVHGDSHGGGHAVFLPMPPMKVNLYSESGQARYMRLSVVLELESESDKAMVEAVMPRVVDEFQTYLRELRVEDLRGSSGRYRLEAEMLWRVNQAAHPAQVRDVLFQEILIN